MRVYATPEDLNEWDQWEKPPESPKRLLRAASALIDDAMLTARYSTDQDGYPTDPALREAFRDATCAQAALWHALGIDPSKGTAGVTGEAAVTGKSIGSASITRTVSQQGTADRAAAVTQLCEQARIILAGAVPAGRIEVVG